MKSNEYLFKLNTLPLGAPQSLRSSYEFLYACAKSKEKNNFSTPKPAEPDGEIFDVKSESYDVLSVVLDQFYNVDKVDLLRKLEASVTGSEYQKYSAYINFDDPELFKAPTKQRIAQALINFNAPKYKDFLEKKISILCLHKKDAINPYYSQFSLLADIGIRVYFEHKLDKAVNHVLEEIKKGFLPVVFLHQVEPFFDGPKANSEKNIKWLEEISKVAKLVFVWHNETPHSQNLLNKVYPYHIYLSELSAICVTHSSRGSRSILRYSRNRMLFLPHPALFPLEKYLSPSVGRINYARELGLVDKKYFMTMGGHGYKNTLSVVIAWQSLTSDVKKDYKLLIVGKDFSLAGLAESTSSKININDNSICVVGDRLQDDKMYSLMRDAYMGVCAYSSIWSSGVLCSFKTLLTPVIYNSETGLSDYCLDDVDGVACGATPPSIAEAFLKSLTTKKVKYQSMQVYCHYWKLDNTFFGFFSKVIASIFDVRNYQIQVNDLS